MAGERQGKCVNIGNCSLADKRETITTKAGQDFVCPECGKGLVLSTSSASASSPNPTRRNALILGGVAVLALAGAGLALRSCGHGATPAGAGSSAAPVSVSDATLRLGGSNTIGAKLAPALLTAYFKDLGCADVKSSSPAAEETVLSCDAAGRHLSATVSAHGSSTAFEGLADGKFDIGMASRRVKPEESVKLTSLGDMTSPSNEHVLGLDGIAVIVHPANQVAKLTVDQVGAIFTGVVTDWKQVGGASGAIAVYARDDKSGTYDTFKSLVLNKTPLVFGAKRFEDSGDLSSAVANDPRGVGFVGLSSIGGSKAVPVGPAGTAPLVPNRMTVGTEDYALSRRLFLYTGQTNAKPDVAKFIEFANSAKGQAVVEAAGFVPLTIHQEKTVVVATAPSDYSSLVANALRLSVDFRFRTGSSDLDNRGLKDLDRVTEFLSSSSVQADRLMLFGFADSRGADALNQKLSEGRAAAVSDALSQRGVKPGVIRGFGKALPVADNSTPDGQDKNRRVEVWVKR
ncbi:substrate-binding domain-containing protein [Glacieibacterium megasporae]|uniref:substrate-binding domain-containing protein n=1 Tax=Glacieibacterium megasporae TaxID=2835787 RepID=UPI001C1DF74F|nr:phosphate ABC transporter substrate-binding/OmpA family protein [Polymorphobacter megasporae]UAJ08882.1 phosphate ABC transporter substrate-binding/OmpA family protein [Polymorphobacter megasporae]